MDVFTYFSPSHAAFYEQYLRPSVPDGFRLHCLQGEDRCDDEANFNSAGWWETCIEKMTLFRNAIYGKIGEIVVFSDPDVIFANVTPEMIHAHLESADLAGQRAYKGSEDLCAGFFALRVTPKTIRLLNQVIEISPQCPNVHDQEALNKLRHTVNHRVLPDSFWHMQLVTGDAWQGDSAQLVEPPSDVAIIHATWVDGRSRKHTFLRWMQEHLAARRHAHS